MPLTASQVTDPLLWTYTAVLPASQDGVCDMCHGSVADYSTCFNCSSVKNALSRPCELVVPISLSIGTEQLHHSLRSYKDSSYTHRIRDRFSLEIAALFHRFLTAHRDCIENTAERPWDTITIVPSSGQRPAPHPLEHALRKSQWISRQYRRLLGPGSTSLDHNQMSDNGFATIEDASGRSVLLLDDTYTTGARAQSAASRLQLDGAHVVAIVPAARYMNPEWEPSANYLRRARSLSFTFDYCCIGQHPEPPLRIRSS